MEVASEFFWLRKIADFMNDIDQIENTDLKNLINSALMNLQRLSQSTQLYWIEKQDKLTASVIHSIPNLPAVSILDPSFLQGLNGSEPVYLTHNPFADLIPLVENTTRLVILPLSSNNIERCVLLLWDEKISFSDAFKEFIKVAFSVMRRVVKISSVLTSVEQFEVQFNAILQTVPQSVIFIDDSGKKSWVNENASKLFNLPAGDVEPAALSAAMQSFRSRADNHEEIYQRGMQFFQSTDKVIREWKWIFSDPSNLVLNVYCTPTNSSSVNGVLWMFEDVTEKFMADKQIQDLNIKLQKASDYKSEFLANMSHELRTPLNSILVLTNLLGENETGNLNARQIRDTEIIYNSGNDLLYLINDILDLSKIEAGRMDLTFDDESIHGITQTMLDLFTVVSKTKNIAFDLLVTQRVPQNIYTDRHRLNQIIKNLLSNAFKFTPSGGFVKLKFDLDESRRVLLISVSDTGIGVPDDKKQEIFEAFKQANGTTTRHYGGTGLGLSISKELVWKFGGTISVESKLGQGSLFTVEIPVSEKEENLFLSESPADSEDEASELQQTTFSDLLGKKVLLVSDDIREVFSLNASLENNGLSVSYVLNSVDFLSLLQSGGKPDVIILDLTIEKNNGSVLLQTLANSNSSQIPVFVITDASDNLSSAHIEQDKLFFKPVQVTQILSQIQQLFLS